jgi:hypothetical protein
MLSKLHKKFHSLQLHPHEGFKLDHAADTLEELHALEVGAVTRLHLLRRAVAASENFTPPGLKA